MKATFENTVDILVKAYFNDTLEHCNCYACAVGNIVAHNNNYTYTDCIDNVPDSKYQKRLALVENGGRYNFGDVGGAWFAALAAIPRINSDIEIQSTGYNLQELRRIENAFERAEKDGDYMFNGLMAVVDVLAEIHGVSLEQSKEAKLMFVKS